MSWLRATNLPFLLFLVLGLSTQTVQAEECRRVLGVGNRIYTIGQCIRQAAPVLSTAAFPNLIIDNGTVRANVSGREGDLQINTKTGELTGAVSNKVIGDLMRYYSAFRSSFSGPTKALVDAFMRWANNRFQGNTAAGGNLASGGSHSNGSAGNPVGGGARLAASTSEGSTPSIPRRAAPIAAADQDPQVNCNDLNESTCTADVNQKNRQRANQDELNAKLAEFRKSNFGAAAARTGNLRGNLIGFFRNTFPNLDETFAEAKNNVIEGLRTDKGLDDDTINEVAAAMESQLKFLYLPKNAAEAGAYFRQCGLGFTDNALFDKVNNRVTLCWGRVLTALAICGARKSPIANCLIRTLMHEISHFVETFLKKKSKNSAKVRAALNRFADCYYDNFFDKSSLSRQQFRDSELMGENYGDYGAGRGYKAKFNREKTDIKTNLNETKEGFSNLCGIGESDDYPASSFRLRVNSAPSFAPEIGCRPPAKSCTFSGLQLQNI